MNPINESQEKFTFLDLEEPVDPLILMATPKGSPLIGVSNNNNDDNSRKSVSLGSKLHRFSLSRPGPTRFSSVSSFSTPTKTTATTTPNTPNEQILQLRNSPTNNNLLDLANPVNPQSMRMDTPTNVPSAVASSGLQKTSKRVSFKLATSNLSSTTATGLPDAVADIALESARSQGANDEPEHQTRVEAASVMKATLRRSYFQSASRYESTGSEPMTHKHSLVMTNEARYIKYDERHVNWDRFLLHLFSHILFPLTLIGMLIFRVFANRVSSDSAFWARPIGRTKGLLLQDLFAWCGMVFGVISFELLGGRHRIWLHSTEVYGPVVVFACVTLNYSFLLSRLSRNPKLMDVGISRFSIKSSSVLTVPWHRIMTSLQGALLLDDGSGTRSGQPLFSLFHASDSYRTNMNQIHSEIMRAMSGTNLTEMVLLSSVPNAQADDPTDSRRPSLQHKASQLASLTSSSVMSLNSPVGDEDDGVYRALDVAKNILLLSRGTKLDTSILRLPLILAVSIALIPALCRLSHLDDRSFIPHQDVMLDVLTAFASGLSMFYYTGIFFRSLHSISNAYLDRKRLNDYIGAMFHHSLASTRRVPYVEICDPQLCPANLLSWTQLRFVLIRVSSRHISRAHGVLGTALLVAVVLWIVLLAALVKARVSSAGTWASTILELSFAIVFSGYLIRALDRAGHANERQSSHYGQLTRAEFVMRQHQEVVARPASKLYLEYEIACDLVKAVGSHLRHNDEMCVIFGIQVNDQILTQFSLFAFTVVCAAVIENGLSGI